MIFSRSLVELRIGTTIGVIAVLVRLFGVQRTMTLLDRLFSGKRALQLPRVEQMIFARRISTHINNVAARMPMKPRCLVRSLAAATALRRRGIPADVQVGIALGGGFAAHAWVELYGEPVNDQPIKTEIYRPIWCGKSPDR